MVDLRGVELLGLLHRDTLVVVAGRRGKQIVAVGLIQTRGVERGVEYYVAQEFLSYGQLRHVDILVYGRLEPLARELGTELVVRIVVVDAVGEPYLLEILLHGAELGGVALVVVPQVDVLQYAAHGEVILEVLVEEYVAAAFGSLRKVIYQFLLLQGQLLEFGDFISQNLDVVEAVDNPRLLGLSLLLLLRIRLVAACAEC